MTQEEYQRQLMRDYREVFEGEAGERVLRDICRLSGLFHDLESNDPIELARAMGKQDLAKSILSLHGRGLDLLMEALKEGETNGRSTGTNGRDYTTNGSEWAI